MKKLGLCASSVKVVDDRIVALQNETLHSYYPEGSHIPEKMRLLQFNKNLELDSMKELFEFRGSRGHILEAKRNDYLVSIDSSILRIKDDSQSIVLDTKRPENVFWHAVEAKGKVFVQEYGESPTGIYASKDLTNWERCTTNDALDAHSRHFHCISYNPTSDWLLATLGDGRLTRVVFSKDLGKSWGPLLKGPWQLLPIAPTDDEIVFGIDAAISRGGVGVYYFKEDKWDFILSKWIGHDVKRSQMCDLACVRKDLWVAALGTPQAIVVSKDLVAWHPLLVESFDEEFSHVMSLYVERDAVVCSTGRTVLVFSEDDLERALASEPVMIGYKSYREKLMGYGFSLKHRVAEII